jgi:hypothetical protein
MKGIYNSVERKITQFYAETLEHKEIWHCPMKNWSKKVLFYCTFFFEIAKKFANFNAIPNEINICFIIQSNPEREYIKFSTAPVSNLHELSGLKQHKFLTSHF